MRRRITPHLSLFLIAIVVLSSCAPKKTHVYYQNIDEVLNNNKKLINFETKLQPDDLLMIIVSAEDVESAAPFNLVNSMTTNPNSPERGGQAQQQLYLIDAKGNIEFPIIGTLNLGGLTRSQAITLIKDKVERYLNNPIINLRIMNFKITVQGEVVRPGVHTVNSERLTLPEALALSGDMTIYGKRENILIIRENNGQRTYNRVDMTKADFLNSPYYFLNQNDIVYVEPNKTRINSSSVGPNISIGISALSLLVTILALTIRK